MSNYLKMIGAQELRIGNYVYRKFWNPHPNTPGMLQDICKIDVVKQGFVNIKLSDNSITAKVRIDSISAILLTPEILEKAGFEKRPMGFAINISKFKSGLEYKTFGIDLNQGAYIRQGSLSQSRENDDLVAVWNNDLQGKLHLHQLQNLYYALTGTELEVTR